VDGITVGTLVALTLAVVGSAWRLSSRLGAIERSVGEGFARLDAEGRGVERRLAELEAGERACQAEVLRDLSSLRSRITRAETLLSEESN